jgi:hypothetical protein
MATWIITESNDDSVVYKGSAGTSIIGGEIADLLFCHRR